MCGIFGVVSRGGEITRPVEQLHDMSRQLVHRGPDACGLYQGRYAWLGARRLRIRDQSAAADQPFHHASASLYVVGNGEVDNAAWFRAKAPGYPWASGSDIESLLPHLAQRGPAALNDIEGMYALAWWDDDNRTLTLARDRGGEKPLFYVERHDEVWFASEISALLTNPSVDRAIDPKGLLTYLALGYVISPRTLLADIKQVPAGTALTFEEKTTSTYVVPWPHRDTPVQPNDLQHALEHAVRVETEVDVPVGVFLSGGVDSALISAIAAKHVRNLPAFTIGFDQPSYDERANAARVAGCLGLQVDSVTATPAMKRKRLGRTHQQRGYANGRSGRNSHPHFGRPRQKPRWRRVER